MLTISIKHNLDQIARDMRRFARQVPFALAKSLTQAARLAAKDTQEEMPKALDRPMPFTLRSIRWQGATKATLTSKVYIMPAAAEYLKPLITGGVVKPKRRALLDPEGVKLNQYGNIGRGAIQRLLARPDVFSGQVRGVPGIWQRTKQGVRLLVRYENQQRHRKLFDFEGIVRKSVDKNFARLFRQNLDDAVRTAR